MAALLPTGEVLMLKSKFIDEEGTKAIEAAVSAAEKSSSGEIVPVVVPASSAYEWIGYRAAFLGWLSASIVTFWIHYQRPFALDYWGVYAFQAAGIVLGWLFSRSPWGFRLLVPESAISEEVLETAQSAFLRHGLMNTRDRTGVLIFVSLREHRVQILADKGIHEKVGERFWKNEADQIVRSIRNGSPAEGLVLAIREIGEKLREFFPARSGDSNELPDKLRTD